MESSMEVFDQLQRYSHPIEFKCIVNGKELTATLVGTIDHPLYHIFRVKFSDGFEDDFTYEDEEGKLEGDKKEPQYANAIENDLTALFGSSRDMEIYVLRTEIGNEETNVWVLEDDYNKDLLYEVHYNGDYRFHMALEGENWVGKTIRKFEPEVINNDLVIKIGHMLNYYRG